MSSKPTSTPQNINIAPTKKKTPRIKLGLTYNRMNDDESFKMLCKWLCSFVPLRQVLGPNITFQKELVQQSEKMKFVSQQTTF